MLKKANKTAALLLAAAITLSGASTVPVSAAVDENVLTAAGYNKDQREFIEMIHQMIETWDTSEVDISDYGLSYDEVAELYGTVIFNEPDFFYVSPVSIDLGYRTKQHVLTFKLDYIYSKSRAKTIRSRIKSASDEILSGISDSWSDMEKVMYVHDRICSGVRFYEGSDIFKGRNIYDTLVKGQAVCVGYSLSFQHIMEQLDIPCICVTSETHMWNMVGIDGKWYHIDLTWDDSADFSDGFVIHNVMAVSREQLKKSSSPHDMADYELPARSSKYDDFFWNDTYSSLVNLGDYWYYTTAEGLSRYSFSSDESQLIYRFDSMWNADESRKWTISFSTPVELNGMIYFNSSNKLLAYDPASSKVMTLKIPKLPNGHQIFDLKAENGYLIICTGTSAYTPNEKKYSVMPLNRTVSDTSGIKVSEKDGIITLRWQPSDNAEKYNIYRKTNGRIYRIGTTTKTAFAFRSNTDMTDSSFAVRPVTKTGTGEYSSWASIQ